VFLLRLKGKKIGVATAAPQLGNAAILKELEQMVSSGAELLIIVFAEGPQDKQAFQNLLRKILTRLEPPDLYVIITGFPGLLEHLAQLSPGDYPGTPLVMLLLPSSGDKPALPQLSSLLASKGVFFVPFGLLRGNRDKEGEFPLLCSRIDLLGETCAAALEGCQLHPFTWDNHIFPH
jgi:hypothetical protein